MATFLQNLRTGGQQLLDGINSRAAQITGLPFLKAVTAGAAMVVAADGVIEDSEVDEFIDFATTHPVLKHYKAELKMQAFQDALKLAKDKFQKATLMADIAAFNGKPEAVTIAEVLCLLASADGNVADEEKKALTRIIGRALGLDAALYVEA